MVVYKRGDVWWMNFWAEGEQIQRSTKLKNKRLAENYERAYRTQLANGEIGIEKKQELPQFEDAISEFISFTEIEHRGKPNTVRFFKNASRALKTFFGNTRIDRIDVARVEKFKQWRGAQSSRPSRTKEQKSWRKMETEGLSPATINRELAVLKVFFNYYIRKDMLQKNPVSRVKLFKEDNGHLRVVSREEEHQYLGEASQPLFDFASVMIDTGMRPSEIAAIHRKDLFLEKGYLYIPEGKTKAAKRRIPLTVRAKEILELRARQSKTGYVFVSEETDAPLTKVKTAHAGAIRRSKVWHFRLYDLRHTFATRFLESGGDLVTLQAILGHSSIQFTWLRVMPTLLTITNSRLFVAWKNKRLRSNQELSRTPAPILRLPRQFNRSKLLLASKKERS